MAALVRDTLKHGPMNKPSAHRTSNCWCGHDGTSHYGEANGYLACKECSARPYIDDPLPSLMAERRRFDRFAMPEPIRTAVGSMPAYIVDASISGIGVLHHNPAPPIGAPCRLRFSSEFGPITLECQIVRTAADRRSQTPEDETTFQTGLRIVAADDESDGRLRQLVMTLAIPSVTRRSGH
jgi:PilZ domain-containing protein